RKPGIVFQEWGRTKDGEIVNSYRLMNSHGMKAHIISWGATLAGLEVPDRNGKSADVTLGFDSLAGYLGSHPFFGVIAGRYANRIAKGKFTLDGKEYTLATNNGANHLHGGIKGFDKKNWRGKLELGETKVSFFLTSPDGDEGYPGTLTAMVTYTLTDDDTLRIDYEATTDKPTVLNLTNHAYWNLAGAGEGDILGHELTLHASKFTPVDDGSIPTGKIAPVAGGPMDFAKAKAIGKDFAKVGGTPGGYDHNFVIDQEKPGVLSPAAEVHDPKSGRVMTVRTTEPGVQFYTGNYLDGTVTGKGGKAYQKNFGLCLETQHFPDSPNKPEFPSTVLRPGAKYRSTTTYAFSVR
ncbi:MAG: aldose epimerase family protein, partial [Chthoniobacteraceae bacterium]